MGRLKTKSTFSFMDFIPECTQAIENDFEILNFISLKLTTLVYEVEQIV